MDWIGRIEPSSRLEANPLVVLKEEPEGGILFDPETGDGFGLNAVGVFVWKRLDGSHSLEEISRQLEAAFSDVPPNALAHVMDLARALADRGLVGWVVREAPRG